MITRAELAETLKTIRVWLVPEDGPPNTAYRGRVLHPRDVADDIITAVNMRRTAVRYDPYPHGYGHRPEDEDGVVFDDPWMWEDDEEEEAGGSAKNPA